MRKYNSKLKTQFLGIFLSYLRFKKKKNKDCEESCLAYSSSILSKISAYSMNFDHFNDTKKSLSEIIIQPLVPIVFLQVL